MRVQPARGLAFVKWRNLADALKAMKWSITKALARSERGPLFIFVTVYLMNNTQPQHRFFTMGIPPTNVYRTFEDWQAEQSKDARTPEERGIHIGSPVMWRHLQGHVIMTDRATVTAVTDNDLTLLVKDVQVHTCHAHIHEIVDNHISRFTLDRTKRPAVLPDQVETPAANDHAFHLATSANW
jgi:hypothetical protein